MGEIFAQSSIESLISVPQKEMKISGNVWGVICRGKGGRACFFSQLGSPSTSTLCRFVPEPDRKSGESQILYFFNSYSYKNANSFSTFFSKFDITHFCCFILGSMLN